MKAGTGNRRQRPACGQAVPGDRRGDWGTTYDDWPVQRPKQWRERVAMSWGRRFRIIERVKGSLWIVPLIGAILGAVAALVLTEIDQHLSVPDYFQYSSSTASTVLSAIVGAAPSAR